MVQRTKVAVLISGRGSNMEALVRAAKADGCPFEIALVLANKPDAGGLATAAAEGIEALCVDQKPFGKDREAATRIMLHVHQHGVGVCGVFTYEVAETKVAQVIETARRHQHPLQCTMEKD